jgi:outer membrane protein OmpA-like peptidoglycan-associated protein
VILFGDRGQVGFASDDLRPGTLVAAATVDPSVAGDDVLAGGASGDLLFGGLGADDVTGGPGNDVIFGDFGRAALVGGVLTSAETTELFSGSGDRLAGGRMTEDSRLGGDGNDLIFGGAGFDLLFGTLAEDVMIFEYGRVTLVDGLAASVIVLGQGPLDLAATQMFGIYRKPLLGVPDYLVAPRALRTLAIAEPDVVVSTGSKDPVPTHHQRVAQTIELPGVEFELGSASLLGMGDVLERIGLLLADFPNAVIEIAGHTDSTGSTELNQALSQQRAEAVRAALIAEGVDPHRLRAVGYGESRPIDDNETEEGRARNRRVELAVGEPAEEEADSQLGVGTALIGALGISLRGNAQPRAGARRRIEW